MIRCDICSFKSSDRAEFVETVNGTVLCLGCYNDVLKIR